MVVARQMQHAMHHQMRGVIGKAFARQLRLAARRAQRERDIAAITGAVGRGGKGQDVGGLVLPAKFPIESLELAVAG